MLVPKSVPEIGPFAQVEKIIASDCLRVATEIYERSKGSNAPKRFEGYYDLFEAVLNHFKEDTVIAGFLTDAYNASNGEIQYVSFNSRLVSCVQKVVAPYWKDICKDL